jgi:hypothetical protein
MVLRLVREERGMPSILCMAAGSSPADSGRIGNRRDFSSRGKTRLSDAG